MTTFKVKSIFALPVLLVSSFAANAATDLDAVEACSDAIATTFADNQDEPVKVRIDQSVVDTKRKLNGLTMFHLDIRDASTSGVVGRFDCAVTRRAKVKTLTRLSLDAAPAELRSRG